MLEYLGRWTHRTHDEERCSAKALDLMMRCSLETLGLTLDREVFSLSTWQFDEMLAHDGDVLTLVDISWAVLHMMEDTLLQWTCSLVLEGSSFHGGEQHGDIVAGGR